MNGEMRISDSPIGKVMPVVDIADAIGYDRSSITKIVKGQENLFSGTQVFQPFPTTGGIQQFLCINRTGLDLLMVFLRPAKTRDSFEKFLKFREQALDRLNGDRLSEVPRNGNVKTDLLQAKEYAEVCGRDAGAFQAAVFKKHNLPEFAAALDVPSVIRGEVGIWFTPTQIAERCGSDLSARNINYFLLNKGFQYLDGGLWRLSDTGKLHGEEYWFTAPSKHSEVRIRWKESIMTASGLVRKPSETLALARVS
jgi:hypothetical protein